MQVVIDLDIESIIKGAVTTERLQPLVDTAITAAIKDAINDATGYHSQFREALKKQLNDAMPHGLGIDDSAKFQQLANRAVSEAVSGANSDAIKTAIQRALSSVFPVVPAKVKLSDLIKEARGGFNKDEHEAFFARLEISEYGGGWLSLDDNEKCHSQYSAEVRLGFNKDGDVFSAKIDGRDVTPKSLPDVIGIFDSLLLSMYVGRTSLELDIDADEVQCLANDQTDY